MFTAKLYKKKERSTAQPIKKLLRHNRRQSVHDEMFAKKECFGPWV